MTDLNADYIRTVARQSEQLAADAEEVALEGTDRRPGALDNLVTRMDADDLAAHRAFGEPDEGPQPPTEAEIVADEQKAGDRWDGQS